LPVFQSVVARAARALHAHQVLVLARALFQSATHNPLASPDLLGVTGGAQLGLLAAMLVPALGGVDAAAATGVRVDAARGPVVCRPGRAEPAAPDPRRTPRGSPRWCRCPRWRAARWCS